MDGKHFKFIISPDNQNVDLEALVKVLVKRMEAATARSFSWLAAVHTDTAHRHAHLLINGTDTNGKDITFDKVFIKQTMREMSRCIATELVGRRSGEELEAEQERLHTSYRYCRLDDEIQLYERHLTVQQDRFASTVTIPNGMLSRRLEHLADMGLAERVAGKQHTYALEEGWTEKLKAVGRYNSFLKAREEMRWVSPADMALYTGDAISGVVTKRYVMNDEDSWNNAVLIENKEKRQAWYVPLYYEPDSSLLNRQVSCEMKRHRRGQLTPVIRLTDGTPGVNGERRRQHNRSSGEGMER
jgi:hypothetical protein